MEPRHDRSYRTVQQLSQLPVAQLLGVQQQERQPVGFRQRQERLANFLVPEPRDKVLVDVFGIGERVLIRDPVVERETIQPGDLRCPSFAALAAVAVRGQPVQDLEEPRPDAPRIAQRRKSLQGLEVGVLDQVFGCRWVAA